MSRCGAFLRISRASRRGIDPPDQSDVNGSFQRSRSLKPTFRFRSEAALRLSYGSFAHLQARVLSFGPGVRCVADAAAMALWESCHDARAHVAPELGAGGPCT